MTENPKKRILLLTHEFPPYRGGIATYCAEMAENAALMGHDVTVMAPHYPDDEKEDAGKPYRVKRFPFHQNHTIKMLTLLWQFLKINPKDYDVIHAAEWTPAVVLHAMWPFKKIPFIATVHGTDVYILETLRLVTKLRGRDFFRHASRVTTNSNYTADLLRSHHPYLQADKVKVTLLGVNPYWYGEAQNPYTIFQRYSVPTDRKLLLTVARLDERKGHRGMLKALALLPQDVKDQLAYAIVGKTGDPAYLEELKTLAAQCGVPVIFTGPIERDDVRNFYQAAWLYCMLGEENAKKIEGFGLSYLEAAAQSLPSLARPLGGIPEVVLHEKTGIVTDNPDPQNIAFILQNLITNPAIVQQYGRNAFEWAKTFTWERCVKESYEGLNG